jgi:hypothetical protein
MFLKPFKWSIWERLWTIWKHLKSELELFLWLAPVVITMFILLVFWRARNVHGVSRVSAQTELISFTVINPEVVNIPVRGVRISSGSSQIVGKCISGSLSPVLNAQVAYGRSGWGPLIIRVGFTDHADTSTAALFTAWGQDRRIALPSPVELVFDPGCKLPDKDDEHIDLSKSPAPYNLPVFGRAVIGSESHPMANDYPEPATLITAKVTVSARATPLIFPGALYQVDTFDLPVGSRIDARLDAGGLRAAATNGNPEDVEAGANWAGIVYLDLSKPGLSVEVETDTTSLRIIRPNSAAPDIVRVTGVKEVFEDPGLLIIYKSIFVIGVLFTFCGWASENVLSESSEKQQLKLLKEILECLQKPAK